MPHITKRAQRLFLFLVLTIGLVFFVVATASYARRWLHLRRLEPFQTASSGIDYSGITTCAAADKCQRTSVGTGPNATSVYVCSGSAAQENAENILACTQPYVTTQLIDAPPPFLKLTDGVCYMVYNTKIEGDSYYVCYERPPPLAYDHTTETIDFNDVTTNGDPVPYTLMTELPLACGLYGTNMAMIGKSYTSTLGNYKYVSTSLDTLKGTYDTINNLRTSYCGRTGLTAIQQSACQALAEFGSAGADPNISTLTGIRDALNTGVTSMSNLYTTTIKPAYDGMNCKTPSIQMPF